MGNKLLGVEVWIVGIWNYVGGEIMNNNTERSFVISI